MQTTFWARGDSNSANNPALNPTGDPAVLIGFVPLGTEGDILLDYNMGAVDPDTLVEIGGNTYQFSFQLTADLPTTNNNGAKQVPDQFEGSSVMLIEIQDYPTAGETTRMFFLPDQNATQAEMDSFGNGAISVQNIDTTTTGVICFAKGTLILTAEGNRPVEDLRVGDEVITNDHGPMPITWISHSTRCWPGSSDSEKPIQIKSGALGHGYPLRDLVVSPQHKMLIHEASVEHEEVLAPAKGLTQLPGVRVMQGKQDVTYYHVMLEGHGLLVAEGSLSESFYPGKQAQRTLSISKRISLASVIQNLTQQSPETAYGPFARRCLTVGETKARIQTILKRGYAFAQKGDYSIAA
jgi:hypothetical protein